MNIVSSVPEQPRWFRTLAYITNRPTCSDVPEVIWELLGQSCSKASSKISTSHEEVHLEAQPLSTKLEARALRQAPRQRCLWTHFSRRWWSHTCLDLQWSPRRRPSEHLHTWSSPCSLVRRRSHLWQPRPRDSRLHDCIHSLLDILES